MAMREEGSKMTATMLMPPALVLLALWFVHKIDVMHRAVTASAPLDRVRQSLGERLARGEITVDEFRRLTALMLSRD
jgi:uncharacterized membrane protein